MYTTTTKHQSKLTFSELVTQILKCRVCIHIQKYIYLIVAKYAYTGSSNCCAGNQL